MFFRKNQIIDGVLPVANLDFAGNNKLSGSDGSGDPIEIGFDTFLAENGAIFKVASAGADGNGGPTAVASLYTVPTVGSKKFYPTALIARGATTAPVLAQFAIGTGSAGAGTNTDLVVATTLPTLISSTLTIGLTLVNLRPYYNAGDVINIYNPVAQGSALGVTFDLIGYFA